MKCVSSSASVSANSQLCAVTWGLALTFALAGCGGGTASSVAPPPVQVAPPPLQVIIGPPNVSRVFADEEFATVPVVVFNGDTSMASDSTSLIISEAPGNGAARFALFQKDLGWTAGSLRNSDPIFTLINMPSVLYQYARGSSSWTEIEQRSNGQYKSTAVFPALSDSLGSDYSFGRAAGGERIASRFLQINGQWQLQTNRTVAGVWTINGPQAVTLPLELAPIQSQNNVTSTLSTYELQSVIGAADGEAFVVSRSSLVSTFPFGASYDGQYLLWRANGSSELRLIAFHPYCRGYKGACFAYFNVQFVYLTLQPNGQVTFFSESESQTMLQWNRLTKDGSEILASIKLNPGDEGLRTYRPKFGPSEFVLGGSAPNTSIRQAATAVSIAERGALGELIPVAWVAAPGEQAICPDFLNCRILRNSTSDRIAYIGVDYAAKKALLYISDRQVDGQWKHAASRDVSELVDFNLQLTRISLSSFRSLGGEDYVIGARWSDQGAPNARMFAIPVSAKLP